MCVHICIFVALHTWRYRLQKVHSSACVCVCVFLHLNHCKTSVTLVDRTRMHTHTHAHTCTHTHTHTHTHTRTHTHTEADFQKSERERSFLGGLRNLRWNRSAVCFQILTNAPTNHLSLGRVLQVPSKCTLYSLRKDVQSNLIRLSLLFGKER